MPRSNAATGRTGRPPVTSRAEILAAARRLIERDGWERLTVRGLAAEVGIGTTTLYHHVRDRQDLLIQLLNEHADQTLPTEVTGDPRDRIVAAGVAMHESLAAWPWAAEVLTVDGLLGRLGESALRMVEAVVAGAVEHGCTPEQGVELFRSIWYYTVGEILVRARSEREWARDGRATDSETFFGDLDPTKLPTLASVGNKWPTLAAQDAYPSALTAFVDGLLAHAVGENKDTN